MRMIRLVLWLSVVLVALGGAVSFGTQTVSATTGPTYTITPARYRVAHKIAVLYPGQYVMQSAASGARLRSGQMAIEINQLGYLAGVASFSGYDAHGLQTTWVAGLYNFHLTVRHNMTIDLLGPLGSRLLGRLAVQRTQQGDLIGHIFLANGRFAIRWHKNFSL